MPFVETLAVNTPISPYAASKKAAEVMAYSYHNLFDFAKQSLLHHVDGAEKSAAIASLLGSDEEHKILVLLACVADQLVLFQGERQWLLAEDVLASFQGFNRNLDVPVVGRDDAHHVDVVPLEHPTVVLVSVCFASTDARVFLRAVNAPSVDVDGRRFRHLRS